MLALPPALLLAALAAAASPEGRPLLYWGARPALVSLEARAEAAEVAQLVELHAALDRSELVLRLTWDRPVRDALYARGEPVSGRLQAVVYLDLDADRRTGWDAGSADLRTGADERLEVGVLALGADPEEKRPAAALVTATLAGLGRDGRRRTLWRADDVSDPRNVSAHGEWLELRLPAAHAAARPGARLIVVVGDQARDGRLAP